MTHENATVVMRDISWLWRTAYNSAVEGCSSWENQGAQVSEAFDAAREVGIFHGWPPIHLYLVVYSFSSCTCPKPSWKWNPAPMCI